VYLQDIYRRTYIKSIYYIFHIKVKRIVSIKCEIIISIKIGDDLMNEKHVTLCNKLLYYLIAPGLLLYFVMIDMGVLTSSFAMLLIFGIAIILGVSIPMVYKKRNAEYKFNISNKYANIMAVLVIFELSYNFYK